MSRYKVFFRKRVLLGDGFVDILQTNKGEGELNE
jgi:hypothetical protein